MRLSPVWHAPEGPGVCTVNVQCA